MTVPRVKICGVRTVQDALVAAEAGAEYVGMVFVPGRRRRIDPDDALIIRNGLRGSGPKAPLSVGLFGDQSLPEVLDTIEHTGVDFAQLCGEESLEYCVRVLGHARVIKVLHVGNDAHSNAVETLAGQIDAFTAAGCVVTLDSQVPGLHGGTGETFDWTVAGRLSASGRHFLLAGGLTPDSVPEAIAVAKPWGVDVSSGVETNGEKDHAKIRNFVANAKRINRSAEVS
ncbi:MAG: phosphoribosylanthranilate isomerase [Chloroflexi bacterium]|nr:phosphoribosylanthranilate isomerase [Chloroflexota bacterium]